MVRTDQSDWTHALIMSFRTCGLVCLLLVVVPASAQVSFTFDYSYDSNGFFTGANASRQTYLETVGRYVAGFIRNTPLAAITPDSNNSWAPVIFDPNDINNTISVGNISVPANTIIVYAGSSTFASATTVAYGGPAGGSVPDGSSMDWISTLLYRGNDASRMPPLGAITFSTEMAWYFDSDPSTVEDFGMDVDFFSEAVHELIHVLGFGTLDTWIGQVDEANGTFSGADSMALFGGTVPLDDLRQHWAEHTNSLISGTTTVQETAMDPTILLGTRKYVTDLDVAGLSDIGYVTTAVPEPASTALWGGLSILLMVMWRRRTMG